MVGRSSDLGPQTALGSFGLDLLAKIGSKPTPQPPAKVRIAIVRPTYVLSAGRFTAGALHVPVAHRLERTIIARNLLTGQDRADRDPDAVKEHANVGITRMVQIATLPLDVKRCVDEILPPADTRVALIARGGFDDLYEHAVDARSGFRGDKVAGRNVSPSP